MFVENGFKDVIVGAELFKKLDITQKELSSPVQVQKIKEIAEFLNGHEDPMFVIGKIRKNHGNMSNLDYLHSYASLNKDLSQTRSRIQTLEQELKHYE